MKIISCCLVQRIYILCQILNASDVISHYGGKKIGPECHFLHSHTFIELHLSSSMCFGPCLSNRMCVSECPRGFWGDRRRCKRCYSSCESCTGSRSDQCTSCQPGHHLTEGANTCTAICGDNYYLDHGWISGITPAFMSVLTHFLSHYI